MAMTQTRNWKQLLGEFKTSGLSAKEFAEIRELSVHTLRDKLRKEKKDIHANRTSEFIQIPATRMARSKIYPEIKITVENGSTMILINFES